MDRPGQIQRSASPPFGYQPALDGLRAVAVALVLVFHAGFGWMSGGYVGVSVFFTLSGFLITTLALTEHDRSGRLDVGAFYARRLRRLLPASLLCLAAVSVAAWIGLFDGATNLRRDAWAALGQVFNWVALAGGRSYAEMTTGGAERTAPLDHYWSLAIEEQFYWVWPLVLVAVLRGGPRARRLVIGGLTLAFALAAPLIARRWGPDAAYWATPARLGEILVGALAALVLHDRRRASRRMPSGVALAAPGGLAVVLVSAVTWPAGEGPAHQGWLPVFALASVAVIVGVQVEGPVRRLLSRPPLVALGTISYGVYLYHWPVFGLLDETRTGLGRTPLFALRLAVTLAVSTAGYVFVERPIRESRWSIRPVSRYAVAGCAITAALVIVAPIDSPAYWAGSGSEREAVAIERAGPGEPLDRLVAGTTSSVRVAPATAAPSTAGAVAATTPTPTTLPPDGTTTPVTPAPAAVTTPAPTVPPALTRPVRILVVGDSTASAAGEGLVAWAAEHPDMAQVTIRWAPACGFIRVGVIDNENAEFRRMCDEIFAALPRDVATLQPDVVMLMATVGDTEHRSIDGTQLQPGEEEFAALMGAEYQRFLDELVASGVGRVAWVISPAPGSHAVGPNLSIPPRWTTLRSVVEATVAGNPGIAVAVDVAGWVDERDPSVMPDGLHLSTEAATALAAELLAPALITHAVS